MNGTRAILVFFLLFAIGRTHVLASDKPVFGPQKYAMQERYGKANKYTASVPAAEATYLIKLQNGETPAERSDYIELAVNGRKVVLDGRYAYNFIACFVPLKKDNELELVIKEERPSGFRRPPKIPKNVTLSVLPAPEMQDLHGSFGLSHWDALTDLAGTFRAIKREDAARLAMDSMSFHLTAQEQAAAVRSLSDLNDRSADAFMVRTYQDRYAASAVRAEAALGVAVLGTPQHVPLLLKGMLEPDELISAASARGLSFYPEEQTGEQLIATLQKIDRLRTGSTIRTIVASGWKPVRTMITMTGSPDPYIAAIAINMLGGMRDPRATGHLLAMAKSAGEPEKAREVIRALGETGDPGAADALMLMASDPRQRAGKEAELAETLARLGDRRAAEVIGQMIKQAPSEQVEFRLRGAYRRLTGKDY
jgi:HEAT repeat protein